MKNQKITIAIPAFNEEQNIANLLRSIISQDLRNINLEKILVIMDGSKDRTLQIVRKFAKKNRLIKYKYFKNQKGKLTRLNHIYQTNTSDILVLFDADIILAHRSVIRNLIKTFNKSTLVVAAHEIPIEATTFFERIMRSGYILWDETRLRVNKGNHIHNLRGSGVAIKKDFARSVHFPNNTTSDQGYLYIKTYLKSKNGFKYSYNAPIIYRYPTNLTDCRLQGTRAIFTDKSTLSEIFGVWIYGLYKIPSNYKLRAVAIRLFKDPIYTILTILIGYYVRLFPYRDKLKNEKGKWTAVSTTKIAINLSNKMIYEKN